MTQKKLPILQMLLVCTITFATINFMGASAYSNQSNTSKIRFIQPTLNNKPENRGAPRDRKGAGTRNDCPPVNKFDFTTLVPSD